MVIKVAYIVRINYTSGKHYDEEILENERLDTPEESLILANAFKDYYMKRSNVESVEIIKKG